MTLLESAVQHLPQISLVDIRDSDLITLLRQKHPQAMQLLHESRNTLGIWSRMASTVAFPVGDMLAKQWLQRSCNPYRHEIEQFADIMGVRGIYTLNIAYEWACTTGIYHTPQGNIMLRVLDWPFPTLGKHTVVAHQQGTAGAYYNITWPAMSGVIQAFAPQRFAAAINQAPMQRHDADIVSSWVMNRIGWYKSHALPPAHLLRQVFDTATDYAQAQHMLATHPITLPVIYTLASPIAGEGCIIERTQTMAQIRPMTDHKVWTANHFRSALNGIGKGWRPRPVNSYARDLAAANIDPAALTEDFAWYQEPIANKCSRLCVVANITQGTLSVMGVKGALPVTQILSVR